LQQIDDIIENEKLPDQFPIPNPGQQETDELCKPDYDVTMRTLMSNISLVCVHAFFQEE